MRATGLLIVVGIALVLALAATLSAHADLAATVSRVLISIVALAFLPDGLDLLLRFYWRGSTGGSRLTSKPSTSTPIEVPELSAFQKSIHLKPWALVVSVHNLEGAVAEFVDGLRPFLDHLWVVDDASNDRTIERLSEFGVRTLSCQVNQRKPGALRQLLRFLPAEIETVVVIDPDVSFAGSTGELDSILFDFQRSGMQAMVPRIDVRSEGLLSSLQRLEYFISLSLGRKSLADFTTNSGLSIYDRRALQGALERHSLSVYAEDLEISLILLGDGGRIYYDDRARFETEAKQTWSGLFSQRVGWSYGLARVYLSRLPEIARIARRRLLAAYQYVVYLGIMNLLLQPLRSLASAIVFASLVTGILELGGLPTASGLTVSPMIFLGFYLEYLLIAFVGLFGAVPPGRRLELVHIAPLYPIYCLILTVPTTIGYLNWLSLRLVKRRIYSDHYQSDASLASELSRRPSQPEGVLS